MKILSSSPYSTFNPREWESLSGTSNRFSNVPIKIKKKYFNAFKNIQSTKIKKENNDLPKQIQLVFT